MTKRSGLAALLLLLPVGLSACGSGDTPSTMPTGSSSGSSSASAAPSPYGLCEKAGPIDKDAYLEAADKGQPKDKTYHLDGTIDLSQAAKPGSMAITGDVDGTVQGEPKMSMTIDMGANDLKMLWVDQTIYMSMGKTTQGKYIKMTAADLKKLTGMDIAQMSDPAAAAKLNREALVSAECIGREDLGGVKTAHLRVTADPAKVAKSVAPSNSTVSSALGTAKPSTVDMWVDEGNRPLKIVSPNPSGTMTMTMSKWGEPVTVTPPPSAEVTTMPGM